MASLSKIPPELLMMILEQLELRDLPMLMRLNKSLHAQIEPQVYANQAVQDIIIEWAVKEGKLDCLQLLLRYSVDPLELGPTHTFWNGRNSRDSRMLKRTTNFGELSGTQRAPYNNTQTTLTWAMFHKQHDVFQVLLDAGALRGASLEPIRHTALRLIHLDSIVFLKLLLQRLPAEDLLFFLRRINFPLAPLIAAGIDSRILEILLKSEPHVDGDTNAWMKDAIKTWKTPIETAIHIGDADSVDLLFRYGADIDQDIQDNICVEHNPRSALFQCMKSTGNAAIPSMLNVCMRFGQKINGCTLWPIAYNERVHCWVMTPLFEYLYSLRISEINETLDVASRVELMLDRGALMDPLKDKDFLKELPIPTCSCAENWVLKFLLTRWGVGHMQRSGFYKLVRLCFEHGGANGWTIEFPFGSRDLSNFKREHVIDGQKSRMRMLDLLIEFKLQALGANAIKEMMDHLRFLMTELPEVDEQNVQESRLGALGDALLKASYTQTASGFCNTCQKLAALDPVEAQAKQKELWREHMCKSGQRA